MPNGKQEGFEGQLLFRLNPDQLHTARTDPIQRLLYVTAIGYYPHAANHYISRSTGIESHILIHCISGSGWYRIGHTTYTVCAGEFFIIPAGYPHRYGSNNDWCIYWVHVEGEQAEAVINQLLRDDYAPKAEPQRDLSLELFRSLLRQLAEYFTDASLSYLNYSIWHLLGIYSLHESFSESGANRHQGIQDVISYMKDHVAEHLTLQELAAYADLSVSRFSQLFKEQTGHSPVDFYIRLKIQRAGQLLTSTSLKIQDIASLCGWDNPYYFSRAFSKITGHAPREYRKLYYI